MFNQPTLIMTYLVFVYIFIIFGWAGHAEKRLVYDDNNNHFNVNVNLNAKFVYTTNEWNCVEFHQQRPIQISGLNTKSILWLNNIIR